MPYPQLAKKKKKKWFKRFVYQVGFTSYLPSVRHGTGSVGPERDSSDHVSSELCNYSMSTDFVLF